MNPRKIFTKNKILCLLTSAVVAGCQPTLIAEFEDLPVVSCFLDAGRSPILTVSKLIAFRDDALYSNENVSTLEITITDETQTQTYQMQPLGEGRYENPQFIVQANHSYRLTFTYNGKHIEATTTVPASPLGVTFSSTVIAGGGFGGNIEIEWENDERDFYIVEGFTQSTTPIRETDNELPKSFQLDYTQEKSATLSRMQFNYYGYYEVSLIRILPQYVEMSQGGGVSSTDLIDARGNIEGGYGIFTGVNRVVRNVYVYQE
jgi:hypothetical protein